MKRRRGEREREEQWPSLPPIYEGQKGAEGLEARKGMAKADASLIGQIEEVP